MSSGALKRFAHSDDRCGEGKPVIALTRLNQVTVLLNSDLIETVEATPDTVIRLVNGQRLIVCEKPEVILQKVRRFRRSVLPASLRKVAAPHCVRAPAAAAS